jgi:hypothetical protein
MCKKTNYKIPNPRIDKCMVNVVRNINWYCKNKDYLTVIASCCGHNKYPMTIVVKNRIGFIFDFISDKEIPRKRNFYKRDKQGYYYIPECVR